MKEIYLTCIECPMGCRICVKIDQNNTVEVIGNTCPRGKLYAQNEIVCPMRVVTSTVMTDKNVPISVKTDNPVKKSEMFVVMKKINAVTVKTPIKIGDVIISNISDGANVVATMNMD